VAAPPKAACPPTAPLPAHHWVDHWVVSSLYPVLHDWPMVDHQIDTRTTTAPPRFCADAPPTQCPMQASTKQNHTEVEHAA